MSFRKTTRLAWSRVERHGTAATLGLLLCLMGTPRLGAAEYFEDFDRPGKPPDADGFQWERTAELIPEDGWKQMIPGDGSAHITVKREALDKHPPKDAPWPFQTLSVGPVKSNHRISIRAKNTAIPGVACLLFTYREKTKFDEIDIEIVADDTDSPSHGHKTGPDGGWTDVRLNTWANARADSHAPSRTIRMPITGPDGERVSHRDGKFHIYTIEWKADVVRFYIDSVLQQTIDDIVPDYPSTVIFGMRRTPWAGKPDWEGSQTMLVDWISIEPVSDY